MMSQTTLTLDRKRYVGGGKIPYFQKLYRKAQNAKNPLVKKWYRLLFKLVRDKRHIELAVETSIGPGLYFGHAYCITINPAAVLGKNINLHKGVTIGQENRGIREGVPVIGDNVWIGINATVVGAIRIGNDVLIAPNAYVNCDVPDHSVVFGNPCIIKHRDNATECYINRSI